jgi:hypothetical protein
VILSAEWKEFGTRRSLSGRISIITNIHGGILNDSSQVSSSNVAQRFSWAVGRVTTRPEDRAYSLMGLFGVNMPMLYGEGGEKAFLRLQLEILRQVNDQTILAWELRASTIVLTGLLAPSSDCFRYCSDIWQRENYRRDRMSEVPGSGADGFSHQLIGQFIKLDSLSLQLQTRSDGKMTWIKPTWLPQADKWLTSIGRELLKFRSEQDRKHHTLRYLLQSRDRRDGVHVALLEKCSKLGNRTVGIILCSEPGNASLVHLPMPLQSMLDFDLNDLPGFSRRSFYVLTHYKSLQEEPLHTIRLRAQPASYHLQSSSPEICERQVRVLVFLTGVLRQKQVSSPGPRTAFNPVLQIGKPTRAWPMYTKFSLGRTFSLCFHPKPEQFTGDILPPPFSLVIYWGSDGPMQVAFRVGHDAKADGDRPELPENSGILDFRPQKHKLNDDPVVVVKVRQGAGRNYQLQVAVEGAEALHHGKSAG